MKTVIIGAGMGGLAAAIALAARGRPVTVLEAQGGAGGKLLPLSNAGLSVDSGPTVLTMRWVFEELLDRAGFRLDEIVKLEPLQTLARHYWSGGATFDLFADPARSVDAIGHFAGKAEAEGYRNFARAARRIHHALLQPFLKSPLPTPLSLAAAMPWRELMSLNPFETYWHALQRHFKDPRLLQLFGRYATYCGSSPFKAPATLMLVADVEAAGVWRVSGGMAALAQALEACARKLGVEFHFNCAAARIEFSGARACAVLDAQGQRHACHAVIVNADAAAVATGLFGEAARPAVKINAAAESSLSAITWCGRTMEDGVKLAHHTVFFSDDYEREFAELRDGPARDPTVYVCDQGEGRKLLLINAPANGAEAPEDADARLLGRLEKSGLSLTLQDVLRRGPAQFAKLYPATNGALYGRASHGWQSTFQRPAARSNRPGIYLAGGSVHPGPGVPMAALSGLRAAEALLQDQASTWRFRPMAIGGGMSMR